MKMISIHDLLSSTREFDFFSDGPLPDDGLVRLALIPPLPVSRGRLVWGFRHAEAASRLGLRELPAVTVAGDDVELLSIALKLEGRRDGYSLKEKAAVLSFLKARGSGSRGEEISGYIQSEGLFTKQAEKYLDVSENLRDLVDSLVIDLKTAVIISSLPSNVLDDLANIFASCSASERRAAFRRIYEISVRDSLCEPELVTLVRRLASEEDPVRALEVLRYPRMTEMKETFQALSSPVLSGSGITMTPPPGFEGNGYSISFRFTGLKQLDRVIARLSALKESGDELFDLLR